MTRLLGISQSVAYILRIRGMWLYPSITKGSILYVGGEKLYVFLSVSLLLVYCQLILLLEYVRGEYG